MTQARLSLHLSNSHIVENPMSRLILYFFLRKLPLFQSRFVEYFSKVRYELDGRLPPKKYIKVNKVVINAIKGKFLVIHKRGIS